eukprot:Rmarinus@m.9490
MTIAPRMKTVPLPASQVLREKPPRKGKGKEKGRWPSSLPLEMSLLEMSLLRSPRMSPRILQPLKGKGPRMILIIIPLNLKKRSQGWRPPGRTTHRIIWR